VALVFPTITAPTPGQVSGDPPRMPLETFKALYDDPAKRPLIIDVRSAETYDSGHIAGAISFPEADVDARIAELPKDKLIVAYCQ
jgi:rhodanese-related sulfurtransferase